MPIPRPAYDEFAPARAKPTPYEPPTNLPVLSYRQVLDLYDEDRKKDPVFSQMTLPEYAQTMNQQTESGMFDEGNVSGPAKWIKDFSIAKTDYIESPRFTNSLIGTLAGPAGPAIGGMITKGYSLPDLLQRVGSSAASSLGANEHWSDVVGQSLHGLPETGVDIAPMMTGLGALGPIITGLLGGARTYEQTGSKLQGGISTVTGALIPRAFHEGGQLALKAAGATLKDEAGHLVGDALGQRFAGYAGAQLGGASLMELSHQTGQLAAGNRPDFSAEHFVSEAISQVPFLGLDLTTLVKGGQIASAIKAKNATSERARQAAEHDLFIEGAQERLVQAKAGTISEELERTRQARELGTELSRNEEDARRDSLRRGLQPDFQDLQVPPIQQSVYAPEPPSNIERPPITGQPSVGSPEASGEWAMPTEVGPKQPTRGQDLTRNQIDELKASGEGASVKRDKYDPAYDQTLLGEPIPKPASVKPINRFGEPYYGTTDKPVAKPGGGAADYTPDWQVGQSGEGKRVSTSEVLGRQAAAYDQSKVEPKPITPQVTESVIKPLLSETDSATAIKKIKGVYETVLKPEYGVHDVVLDKLSDESLQSQVLSHMQEGASLSEAVLKTTQGIRNALAEASSKKEGTIITPKVKSLFDGIIASRGDTTFTTGGLGKLGVLPKYVEIGYEIAKNLLKAGALKLSEWRDVVVQSFKEHGVELDDAQLGHIEQRMRVMLAVDDSGDGDSLHTKQRQRLSSAVEGLQQLDTAWDALPPEQKGTNKSPLERATIMRDRILEREQKYSKYPEVDTAMLNALGDLRHNGQVWTDKNGVPLRQQEASVRSYLTRAAKNGYLEAIKKEQGGQEVFETGVTEKGQEEERPFANGNEASERAEKLNSTLHKSSGYTFESGLEHAGEPNERFVVFKTNKAKQSLDEGFRPERDRSPEEGTEPTGLVDETQEDRDTSRKSLESVTEEGEFVDPVAEALDRFDRIADSSDDTAASVALQHTYGIVRSVLDRLTPERLYLDPSKNYRKPGELAARTKLMLEFIMDARTDLKGTKGKGIDWNRFVAMANDRLAPEFRFESDKQANNWWNGTGYAFFTEWFGRQPEVSVGETGRVKITGLEDKSVGAGPSVAEATKAKKERVVAAAIKDNDGNVFTGTFHGAALDSARESNANLHNFPHDRAGEPSDEGFVTDTGRYVDRAEAAKIGQASGVKTRAGRTDAGDFGFFESEPKPDEVRLDAVSEAKVIPFPGSENRVDINNLRSGTQVTMREASTNEKTVDGYVVDEQGNRLFLRKTGETTSEIGGWDKTKDHILFYDPSTNNTYQIHGDELKGIAFGAGTQNKTLLDQVRFVPRAEARLTVTDFLRSYFSRRGVGPELSQRSTDATQRILRAAAFFHGSEQAVVRLDSLPPDVLGQAISATVGDKWAPLIRLNSDITSDTLLTIGAGHESLESHIFASERGETDSNSRAVQRAIDRATERSVPERRALLDAAFSQLPKESREGINQQELEGLLDYSANDPKEFVATLAGIHVVDSTSKGGLARFVDTLIYGDAYTSRALSAIVNGAQSIINALRGVTSAAREGLVSDIATTIKADLKHFNDLLRTVRNSEKTIQSAVSKLTTINAMQPPSFWDAKASGFLPDISRTGDPHIDDATTIAYARINPEEQKVSKLGYAIAPFDQIQEAHPIFKPHMGAMLDHESLANDAGRELNSSYFTRDSVRGQTKLGPAGEALKAIASSPKIREAANEMKLVQNFLNRPLNQTELRALHIKHNLDPSERALVAKEDAASRERSIKSGQLIVRSNQLEIRNAVAAALMSGHDTAHKDALLAADRLVAIGTAQAGLSQLPPGVDPMRLVSSITTELGISPEKLTSAQFILQPMLQKHAELAQLISSKQGTISEQRFGRFAASFNLEGNPLPGRVSGDTMSEVRANLSKVKGKIVGDPTFYDNSDRAMVGLDPAVSAKLDEIGDAALAQRMQLMSPEEREIARAAMTTHDAAIEKELYARGIKRWTQHRKFSPGRETLDMFDNDFHYSAVLPHALAKQNMRSLSEVILMDPIFQQNPNAASIARQQVKNMLAADSAWSRRAREFAFVYQIGLSPVVIATEQIQPLLALPAHLTQNGASYAQGYKYIFEGFKQTVKALTSGKFDDPFIQNIIVQLDKGGRLSLQTIGTILDPSDVNAINLSRTLGGKLDQQSILDVGKSAVSYVVGLARLAQSTSSGISSRVTVVAAALHAKDLIASGDLPPEKAFDYVRNALVVSAPGAAGRAGKPTGIYSGEESRSAVGVLLSLQGYVQSMAAMQVRLIKQAVASRSLTSSSTKAAVQMAATQFIAAGVLGLPGVGLAINILNQAFPDLNVKSSLKTWTAKLGGDDEATGKFVSDLLLRGLPQTLSPVDVSSRLSLSNMLGVSDYDGFNLSHLLGVPGGIVNNLFRSSQQAIHGEFGDAAQTLAPTAIRNVLKAFRDEGAVRKEDGTLLYQPSAGEQFAQSIGFTPKKVAELREFNTLAAQMEKSAGNDQQRFISKTADLLREGDLAGVRSALLEREHSQPDEFSAAEGLKLVVRKMQDQTYPEDPRRGGSKLTLNDRADLLRAYGPSGVAPTEQQRMLQSAQLMQQFGLVGSIDQSDMMKAGYVDLLMQKNPQMTRAQARKKVEEMTRRKPLPTLGTM